MDSLERIEMATKAGRKVVHHVAEGTAMYHWPEFQAFCKRAGIALDLATKGITIILNEGEVARVIQRYYVGDTEVVPND